MANDPDEFSEDLPEPGWSERLGSVRRAAKQLFATRTEIFREELAEKGLLAGMGLAGVGLALAFALLALGLATALVAAVLARLLGGPIAGISAALLLYVLIAGGLAFFGVRKLRGVRPFDFPATRDEVRKDLDAIREEGAPRDEGPASAAALAAERASIRPGESADEREEREEREERQEERLLGEDLEQRFRAGSE
jgi:hypothetical protein